MAFPLILVKWILRLLSCTSRCTRSDIIVSKLANSYSRNVSYINPVIFLAFTSIWSSVIRFCPSINQFCSSMHQFGPPDIKFLPCADELFGLHAWYINPSSGQVMWGWIESLQFFASGMESWFQQYYYLLIVA